MQLSLRFVCNSRPGDQGETDLWMWDAIMDTCRFRFIWMERFRVRLPWM